MVIVSAIGAVVAIAAWLIGRREQVAQVAASAGATVRGATASGVAQVGRWRRAPLPRPGLQPTRSRPASGRRRTSPAADVGVVVAAVWLAILALGWEPVAIVGALLVLYQVGLEPISRPSRRRSAEACALGIGDDVGRERPKLGDDPNDRQDDERDRPRSSPSLTIASTGPCCRSGSLIPPISSRTPASNVAAPMIAVRAMTRYFGTARTIAAPARTIAPLRPPGSRGSSPMPSAFMTAAPIEAPTDAARTITPMMKKK